MTIRQIKTINVPVPRDTNRSCEVTVYRDWLAEQTEKHGQLIEWVNVEYGDDSIIIRPVVNNDKQGQNK